LILEKWQLWALGGIFLTLVLLIVFKGGLKSDPIEAVKWFYEKKTYVVGVVLLIVDQLYELGLLSGDIAWRIEKILFNIAIFTVAAAQARVMQGQRLAVVNSKVAAVNAEQTARTLENVLAEETIPLPTTKKEVTPKSVDLPPEPSPFKVP